MKNLEIGKFIEIKRVFNFDDVQSFANLSLDSNPIHLDKKYAKNSIFKKRIVHGVLLSSSFSFLIGTKLPGIGSIYLNQSLKFSKPIYIDEEATFRVEVIEIRVDKPICKLKTTCFNSKNEIAIEGEAIVKYN